MTDCSGTWDGAYSYDTHAEWVSFRAVLQDSGGLIGGETVEDCTYWELSHGPATAILAGTRSGRSVSFTKIYDSHRVALEPIHYAGTLTEDGNEIAGRWTISPGVSGTFIMRRPEIAAEEVEEAVEAEL